MLFFLVLSSFPSAWRSRQNGLGQIFLPLHALGSNLICVNQYLTSWDAIVLYLQHFTGEKENLPRFPTLNHVIMHG